VTVIVAIPLALTSCSSSSTSSSSSTTSAATGGSSSNGAGVAKVSCAQIPAGEVNASLGTSLGPPTSEVQASVTVCTYKSTTQPQSAIVRIQTGIDASQFAASKAQFTTEGQPTDPAVGLGDEAFTSTLTAGGITNSTVVVRKGSTSLLVTGSATVPQVEALATKILPAL
jgi:hypothetical protein